jgi:hypothetical protein
MAPTPVVHATAARNAWPALPYEDWKDTYATLHMWMQVVGKVRLAWTPAANHTWHAPFYVTTRGLTTSPIPHPARSFEIIFDFVAHELHIETSDDQQEIIRLAPRSVADFYQELMERLADLDLATKIWTMPVEVPNAIRFEQDQTHASYDRAAVERFWSALLPMDRALKEFRTRFVGKSSPVHFFWGSFDLAVTRFSGRTAPPHPGGAPNLGDWVMQDAYSHEVSSCGFWPGNADAPAVFYAYAYPEPAGYAEAPVAPKAAFYSAQMKEFLLPYEAVRTASDPAATLLDFCQSTYEAAADRARWDRAALEWSGPRGGSARKP